VALARRRYREGRGHIPGWDLGHDPPTRRSTGRGRSAERGTRRVGALVRPFSHDRIVREPVNLCVISGSLTHAVRPRHGGATHRSTRIPTPAIPSRKRAGVRRSMRPGPMRQPFRPTRAMTRRSHKAGTLSANGGHIFHGHLMHLVKQDLTRTIRGPIGHRWRRGRRAEVGGRPATGAARPEHQDQEDRSQSHPFSPRLPRPEDNSWRATVGFLIDGGVRAHDGHRA
jgi:hypothetical protein